MAGYTRLTETQETTMIGRTHFMLQNGSTNVEIAKCLKRPITQVDEWIEMCRNAEANGMKKIELDNIMRDIRDKKRAP